MSCGFVGAGLRALRSHPETLGRAVPLHRGPSLQSVGQAVQGSLGAYARGGAGADGGARGVWDQGCAEWGATRAVGARREEGREEEGRGDGRREGRREGGGGCLLYTSPSPRDRG
eukprot:503273-Rhodomonas_salina.1